MMGILIPILMVICAWGYLGRDLFFFTAAIAALWAGATIADRYFTAAQRAYAADNAKALFGVAGLGSGFLLLAAMLLGMI